MKRLVIVALLGAVAVLIGSAATFGVIDLVNVISPFRPRDDDTLREFVPVAFALLVGVVTATLISSSVYEPSGRGGDERARATFARAEGGECMLFRRLT